MIRGSFPTLFTQFAIHTHTQTHMFALHFQVVTFILPLTHCTMRTATHTSILMLGFISTDDDLVAYAWNNKQKPTPHLILCTWCAYILYGIVVCENKWKMPEIKTDVCLTKRFSSLVTFFISRISPFIKSQNEITIKSSLILKFVFALRTRIKKKNYTLWAFELSRKLLSLV